MLTNNLMWSYMAGFFDGEGCVSVVGRAGKLDAYRTLAVQVRFAQKLKTPLERMQIFLKGFDIRSRIVTYPSNTASSLDIQGIGAYRVLQEMLPYLIVKKNIAQDALRLRKLFPPMQGVRLRWEKVKDAGN